MLSLASDALRTGVLAALGNSDDVTSRVLGGFYDGELPPELTPQFPYGIVDSFMELGVYQLSSINRTVSFMIHVYSQYRGSAETDDIAAYFVGMFEQSPFPLTGWNITTIIFQHALTTIQPDQIRHLAIRFKVTLEPIR